MSGFDSSSDPPPARELRVTLWNDRIKPWIDIRSYLRQRRIILANPELDFPHALESSPDWKSPLQFAIQGTIVIAFVVGLLGKVFATFVEPRPVTVLQVERDDSVGYFVPHTVGGGATWETRQKILADYIATLSTELDSIKRNKDNMSFLEPVPYSDAYNPVLLILGGSIASKRPRSEIVPLYEKELKVLRRQLRNAELAPYVEEAGKTFRPVFGGISLVLAAYFFGILIRKGRSRGLGRADGGQIAFLYFVTASLFWPSFFLSVVFSIREILDRYFPPVFTDTVEGLEKTLRSIDDPSVNFNPLQWPTTQIVASLFTLLILGIVVWSYVCIRHAARSLRPFFGVAGERASTDDSGEARIRRDIIIANCAASAIVYLIAAIVFVGYAHLQLWLEHHRF